MITYEDATPPPSLLIAIRAEKQRWNLLVAEALDNSLGAGATSIQITMDKDAVEITDNGWGIRHGNERGLYQLGAHIGQMTDKALGRYGIGIKWQALNAGDLLEFESTSIDNKVFGSVDWAEMIRSDSWKKGVAIDRRPVEVGRRTGTTVVIRRLRVKPPTGGEVAKSREEVGRRYRPALALGYQININGIDVPLPPDPAMTDVISETIELSKGKGATLVGGLLKDPATAELYGVHVAKGYKVILDSKSSFGIGNYTAAQPRIFCRVDLFGDWEIDRFKEDIPDADADALDFAIERSLLPILEKAISASIDALTDQITDAANSLVPLLLAAGARPVRKKKEVVVDPPPARKRPQNNPTKDPGPDQTGPARAPRNNRLLRIEFSKSFVRDEGIGHFVRSAGRSPHVVWFASDCPAIQDYMRRPKNSGAKPLVDLALGWFIYQETQLIDDYGKRLWSLMRDQVAIATLPSEAA